MKLLLFTQSVNTEDPLFGFFIPWISEIAKRVEKVEVICLTEGKHTLPANVRVYSLGKERRASRIHYVLRFYQYLWRLRRTYDAVLVHMNPEYMLLGGLYWRVHGIRSALWYNHPYRGLRLSLAALFANRLFYTSPYAATAHFAKAKRMPAGIDTTLFRPLSESRTRTALYMQGRVMPSKKIEVALHALRILRTTLPEATLTLVGPEDPVYGRKLREDFADLVEAGAVVFAGPKLNADTPMLYARAGVSINLAAAGHFDKTALEPMACETPVVLSSKAFADIVPSEWIVPEGDPVALAKTFARLITLSETDYAALGALERTGVVQSHSLEALADRLVRELNAVS